MPKCQKNVDYFLEACRKLGVDKVMHINGDLFVLMGYFCCVCELLIGKLDKRNHQVRLFSVVLLIIQTEYPL